MPVAVIQLLSLILILLQNRADQLQPYRDMGFFQVFYGEFCETQNVLTLYYSLIFIVVQIFCFGNYIYSDLQISSIYYFSRNANMKKWFITKILHLSSMIFIFCSLYVVLFVLVISLLTDFRSPGALLPFTVKEVILLSLYSCFLCVLTNISAVAIGSLKSVLLANIVHILVVLGLVPIHSENSGIHFPVLYVDALTSEQYIVLILSIFAVSAATEIIGYYFIKKQDIGLSTVENEF